MVGCRGSCFTVTPMAKTVRVPVTKARGTGGDTDPPLYEAQIEGRWYIIWETSRGIGAASAACPHVPAPDDRLCKLGMLFPDGTIICMSHKTRFDPVTGKCVAPPKSGPKDGGSMRILSARREDNEFVIELP